MSEQLRQRDEMQRQNDRVPDFAPKAMPLPRATMRSDDVANVSLPAPSRVTFYAKNGSSPRSGATVDMDGIVEVHIPGYGPQKTSVANALNMGLIQRDAAGGFRGLDAGERNDINASNQQEQQQEQQQERASLEEARTNGDVPDMATTQLIEAVAARVPSHAVSSLAYDFVTNGTMSEAALARVAEASGLSLETGKRVASDYVDGLSRQAATAVIAAGVPAHMVDASYNWMAQHYPVEHKAAMVELAMGHRTGALKELAGKFKLHVVRRS